MVAAANYYDDQVPGLGEDFLEEVELTVAFAAKQPAAGTPVEGALRRLLVHRFSYGVIYRERDDRLEILAVAHLHRHPDYWRHRV